jgi:general secretion pathway protein H
VRRGTASSRAGFTLIEAAITVAILALALGVVLASYSTGNAELRRAAGMLSGTIRASYNSASLTGQVHRLAFSFEKDEETGTYQNSMVKVEASEQLLNFDEEQNPLVRGANAGGNATGGFGLGIGDFAFAGRDANELDDQLDALEDAGPPSTLQAILGLKQQAQEESTATFSGTEHDLDLGSSVHVLDIWVQGMSEVASAGVIYLYFFPHGYTQDAVIHLEDDDGAVFTVQVHALTGKTEVFPEYMEVPK